MFRFLLGGFFQSISLNEYTVHVLTLLFIQSEELD